MTRQAGRDVAFALLAASGIAAAWGAHFRAYNWNIWIYLVSVALLLGAGLLYGRNR